MQKTSFIKKSSFVFLSTIYYTYFLSTKCASLSEGINK